MAVNPTYTLNGINVTPSPVVPYDIEQYIFWMRFLRQRVESTVKRTFPKMWNKHQRRAYENAQFRHGFGVVFDTEEFGLIFTSAVMGGVGGVDFLNMCRSVTPVDVNFIPTTELIVDKNCKIIRTMPDVGYGGTGDDFFTAFGLNGAYQICDYFAKKLALLWQAFDVNILNSQIANVFACEDEGDAESFKKIVSQIYAGNGSVFATKKLYDEQTGQLKVQQFDNDVQKHFIAEKLIGVIEQVICEFDSMVGIENTNTKIGNQGGISDMQIMSNNQETKSMSQLWLESEQEDIDEAIEAYPQLEGLSVESAFKRKEDDNYANVERND